MLLAIVRSWKNTKLPRTIPKNKPSISVLIPARNEEQHILACVQAVLQQAYPANKLDVIVIDDHSDDATATLVEQMKDPRVRLFQLKNHLVPNQNIKAYKKEALKLGISQAKGDYIITTDADCVAPQGWLEQFALQFSTDKEMVLAPVVIQGKNSLLTAFQMMDVAATMLLTGAFVFWKHPILSNGANFGFSKRFFYRLGGYKGNEDLSSGDDIFLLQKAVQLDPSRIGFIASPQALVRTQAVDSWQALFWQRLRWASKSAAYTDLYLISFQAAVFLLCLLLFAIGILLPFSVLPTWAFVLLIYKLCLDAYYLHFASKTFKMPAWMQWFVMASVLHHIYIVAIGLLAFLPIKGLWKGRKG